jgi:hypothetical protein
MVGLMTAAAFVFLARFGFLFLPVNVLDKLTPVFEAIDRLLHLRPSSLMMIAVLVAFLGLLVITVGGSTYLYYRLAVAVRRRSTPVMLLFVVLSLLLGWLLWPMPCNTHVTYWNVSKRTCNCVGVTFSFYAPLVQDGNGVDYCLGWEEPVQP